MRRLRFRLRSILLIIALLAVLLASRDWFIETAGRWREFRKRAIENQAMESALLRRAAEKDRNAAYASQFNMRGLRPKNGLMVTEDGARDRRLAAYYRGLKQKYRRMMFHPWRQLEPGPPVPEEFGPGRYVDIWR
jgi:hypothetical protein